MKKQTDTFRRLQFVMKDINGDNRQIIKTMQDQIEYMMEFIDIQGEILEEKTATDYATVELVTEYGLERRHLLFFMDIGMREVRLGGITHNPDGNCGLPLKNIWSIGITTAPTQGSTEI